ncbi:MAG: triose-phosphate isomerase [Porticoccaceae bacterium]|nr:triose-phosphate isomerase [Porticoccaceae bacterium]
MRKPLVAGNWKMHGSRRFVTDHIKALKHRLSGDGVDVAIFPPFIYLDQVIRSLADKPDTAIAVGAQNVSHEREGAFTGEVAAAMLSDIGCRMVLVGHSERRTLYGESNGMVASKFATALTAGLTPVLCVGETLAEREAGSTFKVVEAQMAAVIDLLGHSRLGQGVIAYEPVWAIGTGMTATPEMAQDVHAAIRQQLGEEGETTRILYGGSVKAANAEALFNQPDIDGGLVGGASLDADEFTAICRKAVQP